MSGPTRTSTPAIAPRSELEPWQAADQVARLAGMIAPRARRRIEDEIEQEIRDAVSFAERSPFPPSSELSTHVFS